MTDLRVGAVVTVCGRRLIPIERVRMECGGESAGVWFHGTLEPVAIIVAAPAGDRVLRLDGRRPDLAELVAEVPGLAVMLEPMPH